MNNPLRILPFLALVGLVAGASAQQDDFYMNPSTDLDPNGSGYMTYVSGGTSRALGDVVAGPFDVETTPYDNRCLGVEEAWGHFWITGRGHTTIGDNYMVHKYDMNGIWINSFPQNVSSPNVGGWGGRDMEADDANNTLWVGNDNGHVEIMTYDPITGGLTYSSSMITGVPTTVRALCLNTTSGNFFTKSFTGDMYEFDSNGTVINSIVNAGVSAYGFGWDAANGTIWSSTTGAAATEIDPVTGNETGRTFSTALGGSQGGADIYMDSRNTNGPSLVMLHQTAPDSIAVYDTSGSPPPPPPGSIVEISAMTVPNSQIDMDSLPLGPVTTADLNAAGNNGGATMANMTMFAKTTSAAGVYNTGVCGFALAAGSGTGGTGMEIIDDSGSAAFDAMTISIDLGGDCTEIGVLIADWVGPGLLNFYDKGALMASYTTSTYQACGDLFFQMTGATFDQVDIDVSTTGGNWCLPQLWIEQTGPPPPPVPTLAVTNLIAGQTASVDLTNCTPNDLGFFVWSLAGGGPVNTPFGTGYVSPPYTVVKMPTDATGSANLTQPVPTGTTGINVWFHGADLRSATLTNALAMTIG